MKITLTLVAVAAAGLLISADIAQAKSKKHPRPPEGFQGQWYTTPGGCSYSRAQAPGYPPSWHLIQNPHHIGQPTAKKSCPAML